MSSVLVNVAMGFAALLLLALVAFVVAWRRRERRWSAYYGGPGSEG